MLTKLPYNVSGKGKKLLVLPNLADDFLYCLLTFPPFHLVFSFSAHSPDLLSAIWKMKTFLKSWNHVSAGSLKPTSQREVCQEAFVWVLQTHWARVLTVSTEGIRLQRGRWGKNITHSVCVCVCVWRMSLCLHIFIIHIGKQSAKSSEILEFFIINYLCIHKIKIF